MQEPLEALELYPISLGLPVWGLRVWGLRFRVWAFHECKSGASTADVGNLAPPRLPHPLGVAPGPYLDLYSLGFRVIGLWGLGL